VRFHLLQSVRGPLAVKAGEHVSLGRGGQLFQHVGELGGAQPAQGGMRAAQPHRGRLAGAGAEPFDFRPVDDPARAGLPAPSLPGEPRQLWGPSRGGADKAHLAAGLGEVQVGGPDHVNVAGGHQLVVQDVPGQQHLSFAVLEAAHVETRRPQDH